MSAGAPSNCIRLWANSAPKIATTSPRKKPTVSVVPVTCLIFWRFLAPQACPIRIEAPEASPITNEIRRIMIGKKVETAASASTPIICPI